MRKSKQTLGSFFDREGVDEQVQGHLFNEGVETVRQFAALVPDAAGLRELLAEEPFMLESKGLSNKAKIARVNVEWETATGRAAVMTLAEAQNEARDTPKPMPNVTFDSMTEAFQDKWRAGKELVDERTPAQSYL